MRSFFCLLTLYLGVLHAAFAQQNPFTGLSPVPTGSPMAAQQTRLFQDFTRTRQKLYQAKVDSILALKHSSPHLVYSVDGTPSYRSMVTPCKRIKK